MRAGAAARASAENGAILLAWDMLEKVIYPCATTALAA
jgi:hypothetical protein